MRTTARTKSALTLLAVAATAAVIGVILLGKSSNQEGREMLGPGDLDVLLDKLEQQVPVLLASRQVPGTAIGIVHEGRVSWVRGFGLADKDASVPVRRDTVFQVGSLSKPVAAWGVMRLVAGGKLDLDAPILEYVTRWRLPPSDFDEKEVTARRLLSHIAGLSLHGYRGFEPGTRLQTLHESLTSPSDAREGVALILEPGSQSRYSGGGYTLLELAVEEVSGTPFADYMEREVLQPLDMANSAYDWLPRLRDKTAVPYDLNGDALPNYLFTAKAAAGLYTTAEDFARFTAASMQTANNGEVLDAETVSLMLSPVLDSSGYPVQYGLGYAVSQIESGSRLAFHGGSNHGWKAGFWALPACGEGMVVLTNSNNGGALVEDVYHLWLGWVTSRVAAEC